MDWLVKVFGGSDMALVGIALAGLMFVTLMMFAVIIMADRTTKEIIGKIYVQQRTLMAFLLKEYEEGMYETLPARDSRLTEVKPTTPTPAGAAPAKGITPEQEADLKKRRETRRKTAEKKKALEAAASGT
jgi:hypothetical protein